MRLSPNGRRLVYVAGQGERPARPMVTVVLEDGRYLQLVAGHDVGWVNNGSVRFCPQEDGQVLMAAEPGWAVSPTTVPAGNALAAAGGNYAVYRTDPRRVITADGRVIPGAMSPAISDDGRWLAYVLADVDAQGKPRDGISTVVVERYADGDLRRVLYEGAPERLRFGGSTLAWEIGRGLLAACADVSNPAVGWTGFALPGAWKCYRPVPVWVPTRGELLLLFVADDGERGHIKLASWTSLRLGEPRGYDIGVSTGSGYDHDARPVGLDDVAVQWLDPVGVPDGVVRRLTSQRVLLDPPLPFGTEPPAPPPPPPPVDPPSPSTPPPPEKEPDVNPTVDQIPRDQLVIAGQSIDAYLKLNPRLGLPNGLWPDNFAQQPFDIQIDACAAYLLGTWAPKVCAIGPFPGDAEGWRQRREAGLHHTFAVIERERGGNPR